MLPCIYSVQQNKSNADKALDVSDLSGGNDRKMLCKYRAVVKMTRKIFGVRLGAVSSEISFLCG